MNHTSSFSLFHSLSQPGFPSRLAVTIKWERNVCGLEFTGGKRGRMQTLCHHNKVNNKCQTAGEVHGIHALLADTWLTAVGHMGERCLLGQVGLWLQGSFLLAIPWLCHKPAVFDFWPSQCFRIPYHWLIRQVSPEHLSPTQMEDHDTCSSVSEVTYSK